MESPHESISDRVGSPEDLSTSLLRTILRITSLWQVGRIRDVDIEIEAFTSLIQRTRRPSSAWYLGMLRATRALMRGEYVVANELGEEFLRQGLAADDRNSLHSFALQRAMAAIDIGGLEEIEPAVVQMASTFPRVEGWKAGVAYLYRELGKHDEARDVMESAIARGRVAELSEELLVWHVGIANIGMSSIDVPDTSASCTHYGSHSRVRSQSSALAASAGGSTDRFLGVLAGLLEDWPNAETHFQRAIVTNRAAGAASALAQTYADNAATLDRKRAGWGRASGILPSSRLELWEWRT